VDISRINRKEYGTFFKTFQKKETAIRFGFNRLSSWKKIRYENERKILNESEDVTEYRYKPKSLAIGREEEDNIEIDEHEERESLSTLPMLQH
jgi:hypothetical protein